MWPIVQYYTQILNNGPHPVSAWSGSFPRPGVQVHPRQQKTCGTIEYLLVRVMVVLTTCFFLLGTLWYRYSQKRERELTKNHKKSQKRKMKEDATNPAECPLLSSLPMWPQVSQAYFPSASIPWTIMPEKTLIIDNSQVIDGRIDHVLVPNDVVKVKIVGCKDLVELPAHWDHVNTLVCEYCPLLTTIPCWLGITNVICWFCTGLTSLPDWSRLNKVWCRGSPLLMTFPEWKKVTKVYFHDCRNLSTLPSLPELKALQIWMCPSLKTLPELPNLEWLNCLDVNQIETIPFYPSLRTLICSKMSNLKTIENDLEALESCAVPDDFHVH